MHTVFALLCFVVVIHWLIFPYPSGLLHWHCGNLTIAPVPAKQPWCIWINTSCEFIMNDCITTTKQSTTNPCAYFLGYTVITIQSFPDVVSPVCPKKYAHGFVVLCSVVVLQSFIMNSHEVFIHIHQGCFAGTGAIVRLPQCQWSKPDGYGKISQCITTTKHSKAKAVCIFLGVYCRQTIALTSVCSDDCFGDKGVEFYVRLVWFSSKKRTMINVWQLRKFIVNTCGPSWNNIDSISAVRCTSINIVYIFVHITRWCSGRLRDFTRSCDKTSYRLVNRGPGLIFEWSPKWNTFCLISNVIWGCALDIRSSYIRNMRFCPMEKKKMENTFT